MSGICIIYSVDSSIPEENIFSKKTLRDARMHLWATIFLSPTANVTSPNLPVSSIDKRSLDIDVSGI